MNDTKINQYSLLSNMTESQVLIHKKNGCDKYDFLAAVGCGAIGGLIDIFLVGAPNNSSLGNWTDTQTNNAVKGFAKMSGWSPKEDKVDNISSAIGFLEKKFKVNYDQRYSSDVADLFNMSTINHHIKSLSHSPDIIGLFFSVLNQLTSTSSFISDGKIITINTKTFELQGHNFVARLFCGISNWLGHIMSDIAGSSGGIGRGTGVAIPFYELFGFCKFGKFNVDKDKQDLATIATRVFQEGYDFRFGLAMAIPVLITELSIRLIWSIRRYFQYGMSLKDCIPSSKNEDLRIMLLFGNGTLCVMDGIDAGVRSGGNFLLFFMQLNLIAWFRFITLVLKEVLIRIGIANALHKDVEVYKKINEALTSYLKELEKIDIELFKKETEEYNKLTLVLSRALTEEGLNEVLLDIFDKMNLKKPWKDSLDSHMGNKNATLEFE